VKREDVLQQVSLPDPDLKKAYHAPILTLHGNIDVLTAAISQKAPSADGGAHGMSKTN
jgi:hypothetical protein